MFGVGFSLYSLHHPLGGGLGAIPHLDIDDCSVIGERLASGKKNEPPKQIAWGFLLLGASLEMAQFACGHPS
jgi:hypothetical protein